MTQLALKKFYLTIFQRAARIDPTKTLTLRNRFVQDMRSRFNKLKVIIKKAIIDDDCFNLNQDNIGRLVVQADLTTRGNFAFNFPTSAEKIKAFMDWLKQQEQAGLLETTTMPRMGPSIDSAWSDKYISDSYQRGVQRARSQLTGAGYVVPSLSESGGIIASMSNPFHVDRLGVLFQRSFTGLKGITDSMDMQISHILGQGLADGDNPMTLAKKLVATIDGNNAGTLGITDSIGRFIPAERRAAMLARTEIIRAHHLGQVQELRIWAVAGVTVNAEWVTAGFKVCPECVALQGKIFTLDEIQNKIPLHPNCRCCIIPIPVGGFGLSEDVVTYGGPGSGNFGHKGRPGSVGGSVGRGGGSESVNKGIAQLTTKYGHIIGEFQFDSRFDNLQYINAIGNELEHINNILPSEFSGIINNLHITDHLSLEEATGTFNNTSLKMELKPTEIIDHAKEKLTFGSFHSTETSFIGSFRHEFGHAVYKKLSDKDRWGWYEVYTHHLLMAKNNDLTKLISKYASGDMFEGFAESFRAFTNKGYGSSDKTKLPNQIHNYLTRILRKS